MPGCKLTSDTLFKLVAHTNSNSTCRINTTTATSTTTEILIDNDNIDLSSLYTNGTTTSSNLNLSETDLRTLWSLLSQMIRQRLLRHEPCLLPELGAFVIIDHPSSEDDYPISTKQQSQRSSAMNNLLTKEPFFVLDTTFARRHRLSRIKKPTLSSALSLSLQSSGNSTIIEPNTTLSSFNMQTIDYLSLIEKSGLTGEQLRYSIQQIFNIIDKEIHPHRYCDIEFDGLGYFRVLFGLGIFEFSDTFLNEFHSTLLTASTSDQTVTSQQQRL
ncbi:unnamed protein product [Didymodactylos carnosus]|uniref:CCDC81 HU domain-containing protein n=1 Tax=Didymodactylos carnosus TaxID=1234261 RepID=A0A814AGS0_9BILA|nr:unnamed protein product [Didymodactylos carnosus]CAF0913009.1 unnamed protein product [Didymodactylos carnosus]CAF3536374.1 unnamed protein product [Didymodactylos carnosus]CAF3693708.1 unnamed protein product [Didymodactylos carnosus]